jgi:hypothetical protein
MSAQVYLAVVIARLVGMQAAPPLPVRSADSPDPRELGHDSRE